MADTLYNIVQGELCVDCSDPSGDAEHLVKRSYVHCIDDHLGKVTTNILAAVTQAAITVTAVRWVASLAIAKDANSPVLSLAQGDLAGGALTTISAGVDMAAVAFVARTAISGALGGTLTVAKNVGLYHVVTLTGGTPADISAVTPDAVITMVVDYDLQG